MKTLLLLSMIFVGSLLLSSCGEKLETDDFEEKTSVPQDVPLRKEFLEAQQKREELKKKLQVKATEQPCAMPEWRPKQSIGVDYQSLELPDTNIQLKLPKQWKLTPKVPGPFSYYYMCRDHERKDRSAPTILIAVITPKTAPTIQQGMQDTLHGLQETRPNWNNSHPEWGTVQGQPFMRAYWKGENATKQIDLACGVSYVTALNTLNGKKALIVLSAQDLEKYANDTLPKVENYILSSLYTAKRMPATVTLKGGQMSQPPH